MTDLFDRQGKAAIVTGGDGGIHFRPGNRSAGERVLSRTPAATLGRDRRLHGDRGVSGFARTRLRHPPAIPVEGGHSIMA